MSAIGFPVLYMPGAHAFAEQHAGIAWGFEQHGDQVELLRTDATTGRLEQTWTAPADDQARTIAARFSQSLDAVPADARYNAWDEAIPIHVVAGNANAHSATGGGYFGIRLDGGDEASRSARSAIDDATRAIGEFQSIAQTDGVVRRPLLTRGRIAIAAGVATAAALVVAAHVSDHSASTR